MRLIISLLWCALFLASSSLRSEVIVTEFFSIHHALDENELQRFNEEIVTKLDAYVQYWIRSGLLLTENKISIYVQPSESVDAASALLRLFGESFLHDVKAIEGALDGDTDILKKMLREFLLKNPPLFKNKYYEKFSVESVKGILHRLKELSENKAPLRFYDNNAKYLHLKKFNAGADNAIVLGGSSDLSVKPHPYLALDTVFHEIGHWFVHSIVDRNSGTLGAPVSATINELMADIFSTTYLNDPCRIRLVDGSCRRNLSAHSMKLHEHLWLESDPHTRNEAVAHFIWDSYRALGPDVFSPLLLRAFEQAIQGYPRFGRPFSIIQLWNDLFLERSFNYINDYSISSLLAEQLRSEYQSEDATALCAGLFSNYLGVADDDLDYAKILYTNAPVVIGNNVREIVLEQEPVKLWFSNTEEEKGAILAHIIIHEEELLYGIQGMWSSGKNHALFLKPRLGDKRPLLWKYNGELSYDSQ